MARGHETLVAAPCRSGIGMRLALVLCCFADPVFLRDRRLEHPVGRVLSLPARMPRLIRQWRPHAVIGTHLDAARHAGIVRALGMPALVYLQQDQAPAVGDSGGAGASRAPDDGLVYLAVSQFLADRFRRERGIECAELPPPIEFDRYRVQSTRESVLAVGTNRVKGFDVVVKIARQCPSISFEVFRSWGLREHRVAPRYRSLHNLSVHGPVSDMRDALGRARVVLVPSRREAWGRIVSEAQMNGIPALASTAGGLPENVGEGGILLSPRSPPRDWSNALRGLWHDPTQYARLCEAASAMARRPQLQPDRIVGLLLEAVERASLDGHGAGRDARQPC